MQWPLDWWRWRVSGGSKSVTIGYKYELGIHMALCHGPIDSITRIEVDRRIAWEGLNTGGVIDVNAPTLFGGNDREGGVSGKVSIEMGADDQTPNSYLQSVLGSDVPAFRGVTCAVLERCYVGNNPYLKPWSFRAQRIHTTTNGQVQWYNEKAAVSGIPGNDDDPECMPYSCDAYVSALQEQGLKLTKLYHPSTLSEFVWPFATNINDDKLRYYGSYTAAPVIRQDWGGEVFRADSTGWFGASAYIDSCDGKARYVANLDKPVSGDVAILLSNQDGGGVGGDYTMSAIVAPYNGGSSMSRTVFRNGGKRWSFVYNGGTNFTSTAGNGLNILSPTQIQLVIREDSGGGGPKTATYTVPSMLGRWNLISATMVSDEARVVPGVGSLLNLVVTSTVSVRINGEEFSFTADTVLASGATTLTGVQRVNNTLYTQPQLFYGSAVASGTENISVMHMASRIIAEEIDLASLELAYLRNFLDYQIPPSCDDCPDMNPAHIIRECLTDTMWGMGYSGSDIDDDAFTYAADQLFDEKMGISLVWSQEMPLEDFIAEILRHIDGVLYVSRVTGKFVLKLIRNDYDFSSLVQLNESNVSVVRDARRPAVGELVASLTVNYWDSETGETGSVTEHNQALFQIQTGGGGSTTVQYPGFTYFDLASRVARRDLTVLSTPLLSCVVEVNRDAELLNIGDAFRLDWPDLNISNQIMRVQQMSLGDGRNNTVKIEAVEDVFSLPASGGSQQQQDLWVDPTTLLPLPASPRIVTELPYYQLTQAEGENNANQILSDEPDAGFLLYAGGRQQNEFNARVDVDSGAGFNQVPIPLDFSAYAYLLSEIGPTDEQIYITAGKDLDLVTGGSVAQIGQELVRVDAVDIDAGFITVGRGVLDTVPAHHDIDSNDDGAIVFWGASADSDEVQYVLSDEVDVRMRTVLGSNVLPSGQAPVDSYTFNSRAIRPYPPGDLRVDGVSYPDPDDSSAVFYTGAHTITWSHRDRLQQTGGEIFDYLTGDIGPEAGTTYLVEAYSTLVGGAVTEPWLSVNVGSDTFYEQDSNTDSNIGEPPLNSDRVHFRVTSLRDGYRSWQSPEVTLVYEQVDSNGEIDSSSSLWTPAEITTALWLDAADAGTLWQDTSATTPAAATNIVRRWDDKSGNGRNATQSNSGQEPVVDGAAINGLNVVSFDGSNDGLLGSPLWSGAGAGAAFVVYKPKAVTGTYTRAVFGQSHTGTNGTWRLLQFRTQFVTGDPYFAGFSADMTDSVSPTTNTKLAGWTYNGTTGALYRNGTQTATASLSLNTASANYSIGRAGTSSPAAEYANVQVAEIVALTSMPSTDTRQLIEGYLAWKWGLEANLPSGHPYEFGPPTI
jgi:hypothetical protein